MRKKNRNLDNPGKIIIPAGLTNPPKPHEVEAGKILALHFRTTIEFLKTIDDYKRSTADIKMLGVEWEIKSPTGKSKHTIQEQFKRASKQAKNIIIDTRRTKLKFENIEKSAQFEFSKRPSIKRVLLIKKPNKLLRNYEIVIEIYK